MIKYKVWDKQNKEFWPDIFTAEALARSHRFPENLEDFYEIIPLKRALEIENMLAYLTKTLPRGDVIWVKR